LTTAKSKFADGAAWLALGLGPAGKARVCKTAAKWRESPARHREPASAIPPVFVYQSGVLIIGYAYGYFRPKDILRLGLLMSAVDSLLLLLVVPFYWPLIGIR
jgi:hypothetical protein